MSKSVGEGVPVVGVSSVGGVPVVGVSSVGEGVPVVGVSSVVVGGSFNDDISFKCTTFPYKAYSNGLSKITEFLLAFVCQKMSFYYLLCHIVSCSLQQLH